MHTKGVYLLVFDGFADWEPAHAIAELRRYGQYRVETVGIKSLPVESMGGMRVLPSKTITDVNITDVALFIVPGGDRWLLAPIEKEIEELLKQLDSRQVPIAAICGATVAVAKIGLLQGRLHTSNGLEFLRSHANEYHEENNYVDSLAVRSQRLITASGLGDVEFAREIFEELDVLSPEDRAEWAMIFRSGHLQTGTS